MASIARPKLPGLMTRNVYDRTYPRQESLFMTRKLLPNPDSPGWDIFIALFGLYGVSAIILCYMWGYEAENDLASLRRVSSVGTRRSPSEKISPAMGSKLPCDEALFLSRSLTEQLICLSVLQYSLSIIRSNVSPISATDKLNVTVTVNHKNYGNEERARKHQSVLVLSYRTVQYIPPSNAFPSIYPTNCTSPPLTSPAQPYSTSTPSQSVLS